MKNAANTAEKQPEMASEMFYSPSNSDPEMGKMGTVNKEPAFTRFVDSFRQAKGVTITPNGVLGADGKVVERGIGQTVPPLAQKLRSRHLQMIAIGGSIGIVFPFL